MIIDELSIVCRYGLAWNPHKAKSTHLISGSFDSRVCYWYVVFSFAYKENDSCGSLFRDIAAASKENKEIEPLHVYNGHSAPVEVKRTIAYGIHRIYIS